MDVSIIIVNYNTCNLLTAAIDSIIANTSMIEYEIIVVDNGSIDDSVTTLEKKYKDKIHLIPQKKNTGFAYANNRGLEIAKGKNILFLNPDTLLRNNAIYILSDYLNTHPSVGACGGNLFDNNGNMQFSFWHVFPGIRFEWNDLWANKFLAIKYHGGQHFNKTGKTQSVGYIIGADLMIPKQILNEIGTFDETFFLFYEETELCFRIKKAGYDIISVPQAEIIHLESQSIGSKYERLKYMLPSRRKYYNKCLSKTESRIANTILRLNCLIRIMCFSILRNTKKCKYWTYILQNM